MTDVSTESLAVPIAKDHAYATAAYLQSTFYEQLVEHAFVAELLQEAWFGHKKVIEVLRSEIDASGFDLVLECGEITRHVQLKTSGLGATTAYQKVSLKLGEKRGGCVVWIVRDETCAASHHRVQLSYRFFGTPASEAKLDVSNPIFKVARHTKGDAFGKKNPRPGIRLVPKSAFFPMKIAGSKKNTMNAGELLYWLFGIGDQPAVRLD